ncbi:transcriptional repressor MprA [Avibacterium paragallinarum]|uniref:transcriptional repressor MprA n=1 Tax=Avibacterium paragallinarum TaxID=728 RepID=UPI0021F796E3|nr:transcriptional repressor MprA [Avibacterium paragallinarum]UXN35321.1 transcriptional repressor MprA [Avibacterium paragallinarum]
MPLSFSEQERLIRHSAQNNPAMPVEQILLARLLLHNSSRYLEKRNQLLKAYQLNDTLFMTLVVLYCQPNHALQPSKLSEIFSYSKTNATRIADELVKRQWLERSEIAGDRRSFLLKLTPQGVQFLETLLPNQWKQVEQLFSVLDEQEQITLKQLLLKLVTRLEHL